MATPEKRLTQDQVSVLLARGGFEKSAGLGAGVHYRGPNGYHLHIRPCGCASIHQDRVDPRGGVVAWIRHLYYDIIDRR